MKKFVFFLSLMCVVNLSAQQEDTSPHYGMHLATGIGANIALIASGITGAVVGSLAAAADIPSWLHRTLKIKPDLQDGFRTENSNLIFGTIFTPAVLGIVAGLWVVYKTPQWTDTYLLDKSEQRTTRRNIITFLNRSFIPYPLGVLLGEYSYNKEKSAAAVSSNVTAEVAQAEAKN